jgi:transcriptional regulator with XRE-family HTH domain
MTIDDVSTLRDLNAQLHKDPEFRREYRRQKPYYDLILEVIRRRRELNLTQKELAKMVGTHQSNISRIESGEHNVRLGTLIEIADALEAGVEIRLVPYFDVDHSEYRELFTMQASSGVIDEQIASRMVSQELVGV